MEDTNSEESHNASTDQSSEAEQVAGLVVLPPPVPGDPAYDANLTISRHMEFRNMFGDDRSRLVLDGDDCRLFRRTVYSIVQGRRRSIRSFLSHWEPTQRPGLSQTFGESINQIYREFENNGVHMGLVEFRAGSMPTPPQHSEAQGSRRYHIPLPAPTYMFGFAATQLTDAERGTLAAHAVKLGVSSGVIAPFLITKEKARGMFARTLYTQARQVGAIIVNLNRKTIAPLIDDYRYHLIDLATITFWSVINNKEADIGVHWCNRVDTEDRWFMASLKKFNLQIEGDIVRFEACLRHIIVWGLAERLFTVREEVRLMRDE